MSVDVMSAVWRSTLDGSANRFVLLALADCADDAGYCWPGVALLIRKTGLSEATVKRSIRMLEDGNLLQRAARYTDRGDQRSNVYRIDVGRLKELVRKTDGKSEEHEMAGLFNAPSDLSERRESSKKGNKTGSPVTQTPRSHRPPNAEKALQNPPGHTDPPVTQTPPPGHTDPQNHHSDPSVEHLFPPSPIENAPTFDDLWAMWPRKTAKKEALKRFESAVKSGHDPAVIVAAAEAQTQQWKREKKDLKYIPYASTWLNNERFDDEIPSSVQRGAFAHDSRGRRTEVG